MISILATMSLIVLLFLTGKIFESVKRFLVLLVDIFLKILNLLGIKVNVSEKRVHTSKKFKNTFKGDIKVVKESKQNNKIIPSINVFALIILVVCIALVVINIYYEQLISTYLYENIPNINYIFNSVSKMDTTFTATMFSVMAFSISKLLAQWKATKVYRQAKREMKLKSIVISKMTSKELLDAAKQKDRDKFNQMMGKYLQEEEKEQEEDGSNTK